MIIPDRWIIVEVTHDNKRTKKVFSGNLGGYLSSSNWRLSSKIEKLSIESDRYLITTASGSQYSLLKNNFGLSHYMSDVLYDIKEKLETEGGSLKELVTSAFEKENIQ